MRAKLYTSPEVYDVWDFILSLQMASIPTDTGLSTISGHSIDRSTPEAILIKGAIYQSVDAERLVPSRHQMYLIPPYSGVNNGANQAFTGQQIQFRIQPNLVTGRIRHAQLEFTLAETGGASSVTPVCSPYLFQYLFVGLNGQSSNQSQILYNHTFYHNLMYKTQELLVSMNGGSLNLMNMNVVTFQGESAIPPGGTALQTLSLESSLICKITPNTLANDVWLVIQMPASSPAIAGSGTLQLNAVNLRLYNELNDAVDAKVAMAMNAIPSVINCLYNYQQQFTQTLTAGVQATLSLTGLASARAATVLVMIQSSTSYSAAGIRTFTPLNGNGAGADAASSPGFLDMRIAAGTSIISGGVNSPPFFLRAAAPSMSGVPGQFGAIVPIYAILMSDNNGEVYDEVGPGFYRTANWCGGYVVQNSDQMILQPGSSFPSGTFTVTVLAMCQASYQQYKGLFKQLT